MNKVKTLNTTKTRPDQGPRPSARSIDSDRRPTLKTYLGRWALVGLGALGVVKGAEGVVDNLRGPQVPDIPSMQTPEGKEAITKGIEEGKYIMVRTDEDHPTLWNLADAITDDDPRPLTSELQDEMGTANLPLGTEVAVPRNEASEVLHAQQYPDEAQR